jgi:hypothetical protein
MIKVGIERSEVIEEVALLEPARCACRSSIKLSNPKPILFLPFRKEETSKRHIDQDTIIQRLADNLAKEPIPVQLVGCRNST